ncbi:hypothetical protein JOD54_002465 [Actinokineospora baliensis]|uniref:MauE/DoxX family redox-associated membrane protein n=1 Tax=Actinokineospora baliensis TaxID=547056 RepID=UPI00195E8E11|nr:MauE/DoxX family redox-associated membrane protein [Actinokineospora baliensis]MBM7772261.1 hypothetical protein [Actinokineospora baliensis]
MVEYVHFAARIGLGLVFLVSAVSKLRGRQQFAEFVRATGQLAPVLPARGAAVVVVAIEVAVLVLLCSPWAATGFVVAGLLLLAFTTALVLAVVRGRKVRCQCFGDSTSDVGWLQVSRNVVLLALAAAGAVGGTSVAGLADTGWLLVALAAGALVGAAVVLSEEVVGLFTPVR